MAIPQGSVGIVVKRALAAPGYEAFIFVTTFLSVINWLLIVLPFHFNDDVRGLLWFMEPILTSILLIDFSIRLHRSKPQRMRYMNHQGGWVDLIGSLPGAHILRLYRLVKSFRAFRHFGVKATLAWFVANRARGTLFLVFALLLIVLEGGGLLILLFETGEPGSNIVSGGDALWFGVVTVSTVGYGEYYPVTPGGKITASVMIFAGLAIVGIFTAWAASSFLRPSDDGAPSTDGPPSLPDDAPAPMPVSDSGGHVEHLIRDLRTRIDELEHAVRRGSS